MSFRSILYIKRDYSDVEREDLKARLLEECYHQESLTNKHPSIQRLFDTMSSALDAKFRYMFEDGSTFDPNSIIDFDPRTLSNFMRKTHGHLRAQSRVVQAIDAYLQTRSKHNELGAWRFETDLGRLTKAQLSHPSSVRVNQVAMENLEGVYVAFVDDLPLLFPNTVRSVLLVLGRGSSPEHTRVTLMASTRRRYFDSLNDDPYDLTEYCAHSYRGIGVPTSFGLNCHLRDPFYRSGYIFLRYNQRWHEKDFPEISLRCSSQYIIHEELSYPDYSLVRSSREKFVKFANSLNWMI